MSIKVKNLNHLVNQKILKILVMMRKNFLKNVIFVVGKKGLKNQRNFINSFFPENVNIRYS